MLNYPVVNGGSDLELPRVSQPHTSKPITKLEASKIGGVKCWANERAFFALPLSKTTECATWYTYIAIWKVVHDQLV